MVLLVIFSVTINKSYFQSSIKVAWLLKTVFMNFLLKHYPKEYTIMMVSSSQFTVNLKWCQKTEHSMITQERELDSMVDSSVKR